MARARGGGESGVADEIGEHGPAARQPGLHGADRHPERLGDLVHGHVGEVVQHDRLAGRSGQLLQRVDQQHPVGIGAGHGVGRDHDPAGAHHRVEQPAPAPPGAGEVDGDGAQPRLRVGDVEEDLRPGQRARVGLLHQILSLAVVGGEPVERRDEAAIVGLVRRAYRLSRLEIVSHRSLSPRATRCVWLS